MNKTFVIASIVASLGAATCAEESTWLDGGWRISAGAVFNSPVKANLHLQRGSLGGFGGISSYPRGQTAAQAKERAQGMKDGTKTTYPSGAWIDSADAHKDGRHTWNLLLPNGTFKGDSFQVASEDYSEVIDTTAPGAMYGHGDESAMPGISIDLSRNVWQKEEWKCGVDIDFGLMYFFRTDVFKADVNTGSTTYRSGKYVTDIKAPDDVMDDWSWNDDGTYGGGSYEGPGPVFDLGSLSTRDIPGSSMSGANSVRMRGDYRELELILSARPYYDLTEWCRLYGTLGLVVSRSEFDLHMSMRQDGRRYYARNRDIAAWDVYGIAGLGAMFRYESFTLGFDFLARFLDDHININDRYVHGTVERGNWVFKLMLGYEF